MNEQDSEMAGARTKSQEYYWEQETQLFTIRRFFYEHNLLPKDDSYFPNDVIKTIDSLHAEVSRLKKERDEYHDQYHLCEAKLLSHKSIIRQGQVAHEQLKKRLKTVKKCLPICTCGDERKDHFGGEGACNKCACTWYHPHPNLGRIVSLAKKLIMAFPAIIPEGQETLEFNVPAYIVEELKQALAEKGDG